MHFVLFLSTRAHASQPHTRREQGASGVVDAEPEVCKDCADRLEQGRAGHGEGRLLSLGHLFKDEKGAEAAAAEADL